MNKNSSCITEDQKLGALRREHRPVIQQLSAHHLHDSNSDSNSDDDNATFDDISTVNSAQETASYRSDKEEINAPTPRGTPPKKGILRRFKSAPDASSAGAGLPGLAEFQEKFFSSSPPSDGDPIDRFNETRSNSESNTPPNNKPGRIRRWASAHGSGFFGAITPPPQRQNSTLDLKTIECIQAKLKVINGQIHRHHSLNPEKSSLVDSIASLTSTWSDTQINELSNILKAAQQPTGALKDGQITKQQKSGFETQLKGLGKDLDSLFGEDFKSCTFHSGANNCFAILEHLPSGKKITVKRTSISCAAVMDGTSFHHAYAKSLPSSTSQSTPSTQILSDIYDFQFITNADDFTPSYDDPDNDYGWIHTLHIGAYYEARHAKSNLELREVYRKAHLDAARFATNPNFKANITYSAIKHFCTISKGLLDLVKKGIYNMDIKGGNFIIAPDTDEPVNIDFKTATIRALPPAATSHAIVKSSSLEITPGYYNPNSIRPDMTIPCVYPICQAILMSFYEAVTGKGPSEGESWKNTLNLEPLLINGNESIKNFLLRWENLLDRPDPHFKCDQDYLELMVKEFEMLSGKILIILQKKQIPPQLLETYPISGDENDEQRTYNF